MPTIGNIHEGIGEHWSMPPRSSYINLGEWESRVFTCPICEKEFSTNELLEPHIASEHHLTQPFIVCNDRKIESKFNIRNHLEPGAIRIYNCTNIEMNKNGAGYNQCSQEELIKEIMDGTDAFYKIKMLNTRVEDNNEVAKEYEVSVGIINKNHLKEIDRLFVDFLAKDELDLTDISQFADKCGRRFEKAKDYYSALTEYCFGTMMRDGLSNEPFQEFKKRYEKSFNVLSEYKEGLPVTVSNCIKFVLNDFKSSHIKSGIQKLDFAMEFFRSVTNDEKISPLEPPPVLQGVQNSLCPIDKTLDEFLETLGYWLPGKGFPSSRMDKISEKVYSGRLSDQDRQKFQVLLSASHIEANQVRNAKPQLRQLSHSSVFGAWAEKQLVELS